MMASADWFPSVLQTLGGPPFQKEIGKLNASGAEPAVISVSAFVFGLCHFAVDILCLNMSNV